MKNIDYPDLDVWIRFFGSISSSRDKLIFGILYSSGCSEKELVFLKVSDISFNEKYIIFRGKTALQTRKSCVGNELIWSIKNYCSSQGLRGNDYLLKTRQNPAICEKRIQQIVSSYSLKGIRQKLLPKTIRYTHIAHALLKNVPIFSICAQTGLKAQRILQIASELKLNINYNSRYEL